MAISFQNNLFNNSFANAFDNLKPRIAKGRDNGEKTENNNAKAGTQDSNVTTISDKSKQSVYNISPVMDKGMSGLANLILKNLDDAIKAGDDEYVKSTLDMIVANSKLPVSAADAPGGSKGVAFT
ncbi:hypothetical protein LS70_007125 [Helicobacter sp. MIT 11-5569]|uniref:hypothetical protein n=1 Tax=Helicobacter sp. MIT 11-5569 TaxID=1548151 RepID=UPI00051FAB73|nr:hypothetical protein [Helicobacter sp. MIT 11-5569]TLD82375.1 hypothetical protein LS70_007125 [Helicobacter sp. MIT 11-5569]